MDINKEQARKMSEEIRAFLTKKWGDKLSIKTIKSVRSDDGIKFSFEMKDESEDKLKEKFEKYCHLYDLQKGKFGEKFKVRGKTYKLIGFELNRPKFCILTTDENGDEVGFTREILDLLSKTDD